MALYYISYLTIERMRLRDLSTIISPNQTVILDSSYPEAVDRTDQTIDKYLKK